MTQITPKYNDIIYNYTEAHMFFAMSEVHC